MQYPADGSRGNSSGQPYHAAGPEPDDFDFSALLSKRLQEHEQMLTEHRRHLEANRSWLMQSKQDQLKQQELEKKKKLEEEKAKNAKNASGGSDIFSEEAVASAIAGASKLPAGRLAKKLEREHLQKAAEREQQKQLERKKSIVDRVERTEGTDSIADTSNVDPSVNTSHTSPNRRLSMTKNRAQSQGAKARARATSYANDQRLREQMKRNAKQQVAQEQADEEELTEVTGTPKISAQSARLAEQSREKQGLDGVPIYDSLTNRDAKSRAEKWVKAQKVAAEEVPGKPAITPRAASIYRPGEVGQRLYDDAQRIAVDREASIQEAQLRELVEANMASHASPHITRRGNQHRTSGAHLYAMAEEQLARRQALVDADIQAKKAKAVPATNPQSEAIVARLEQGTMERLCAPKRHVEPPEGSNQFSPAINRKSRELAERRARSLTPVRRRGRRYSMDSDESGDTSDSEFQDKEQLRHQEKFVGNLYVDAARRKAKLEQARQEKAMAEIQSHPYRPTLSPRNAHHTYQGAPNVLDRVSQWEARRAQRRLEILANQNEKEVEDCTFAPRVHSFEEGKSAARNPMDASSLYGGDGKAWGHSEHVDRQRAARERKAAEEKFKAERFASGSKWTGETTKPKEPKLGRYYHNDSRSGSEGSQDEHGISVAALAAPHEVAMGTSALHRKRRDQFLAKGEAHLMDRDHQQYEQAERRSKQPPQEDARSGFGTTSSPSRDVSQIMNHYLQSARQAGAQVNIPIPSATATPQRATGRRGMSIPAPPPDGPSSQYYGAQSSSPGDVSSLLGLSPVTPARAGANLSSARTPPPDPYLSNFVASSYGAASGGGATSTSGASNNANANSALRTSEALAKARAAISRANQSSEALFPASRRQ